MVALILGLMIITMMMIKKQDEIDKDDNDSNYMAMTILIQ